MSSDREKIVIKHWYTPFLIATRCGEDAAGWFPPRLTRVRSEVTCKRCNLHLNADARWNQDGSYPERCAERQAKREQAQSPKPATTGGRSLATSVVNVTIVSSRYPKERGRC